MQTRLVDSHCHLDRLDLGQCGGDINAILEQANQAGVGQVLCIAIEPANIDTVLEIASRHPHVFATVGVHPLHAAETPIGRELLVEKSRRPGVIGIGETGLDYYYDQDSKQAQQESFAMHLQVAAERGLPVVVHTRDARQDTIDLIRSHGSMEHGGVLHCFTEDLEMARQALDLNYYISVSGILTFRNAGALRDVIRQVPLDRLLVETDAPYLTPVPHRGKANRPAFVRHVAEALAALKGESLAHVAEVTSANFQRLFPLSVADG